MIVRCGRCRSELEVSGAGEFVCPSCGTRNVVRGTAPNPYPVPDLTVPGGGERPPSPPAEDTTRWIVCPACAYRFAVGQDLGEVSCPNCRAVVSPEAPEARSSSSA